MPMGGWSGFIEELRVDCKAYFDSETAHHTLDILYATSVAMDVDNNEGSVRMSVIRRRRIVGNEIPSGQEANS